MKVRAVSKFIYLSERRFEGDEFTLAQPGHFNQATMAKVPGASSKRRRSVVRDAPASADDDAEFKIGGTDD